MTGKVRTISAEAMFRFRLAGMLTEISDANAHIAAEEIANVFDALVADGVLSFDNALAIARAAKNAATNANERLAEAARME